jgi:hypothetical protein
MSTQSQSQTYWKRFKVPAELVAQGWEILRDDSTAPFKLKNPKLDLMTAGYPDPNEAIESARAMMIEDEERRAIAEEGSHNNGDAPRAGVLPVDLIDEGWRLNCDRVNQPAAPFVAIFREHSNEFMQTSAFATAEQAISAAIDCETKRQKELEARETAPAAAPAEDRPWDDKINDMAGEASNGEHSKAPAELMLEISRIRLDGGTQQRVKHDEQTIERYADAMRAGARFPAVDVFFDGLDYWLADGFYRCRACQELRESAIAANVVHGTQREAILFSLGCNETHGLPRSNEDKRHAVLVMLNDPEWAAWSNQYIAEVARVSAPLVGKIRKELKANDQKVRKTRSGKVIDTTNIGAHDSDAGDDRQLGLDSVAAVAEPAETQNPPASEQTSESEPQRAADPSCVTCGKVISAGMYRDGSGRCAECSPNTKRKAERPPSPAQQAEKVSPSPAPSPTISELTKGQPVTVQLAWSPRKPIAIVLHVGKRSAQHSSAGETNPLSAAVVKLIELLLRHRDALEPATPARRARKPAAPGRKRAPHRREKELNRSHVGPKPVPKLKTTATKRTTKHDDDRTKRPVGPSARPKAARPTGNKRGRPTGSTGSKRGRRSGKDQKRR